MSLRREEPPTIEEVIQNQWWWNFCPHRRECDLCHIMQFDIDADRTYIIDVISSIYAGETVVFRPEDWPGQWAPALPPE